MTRVVAINQTGGPEVLSVEDWPVAAPGPGQVVIEQKAIGLNFIDTYQRSGLYPQKLPFVGGNEGAGVVKAVGPDVTAVRVGDRVCDQGQVGAYAAERLALVESDPRFHLPAESYLSFNWVHATLAELDSTEARELVVDAWRMVVPQKLSRTYDFSHPEGPGGPG